MSPWPQPTSDGAMCGICLRWIHIDDLSVDPEDGKKWDLCKECYKSEYGTQRTP